ncbi:hypothetical protein ACLMJK_007403 [Lecanora helva]
MNLSRVRAHKFSSIDPQIKNIEAFGTTLDNIATAAFPRDGRSRYNTVHVLLLSWQDDSKACTKETLDLECVFRQSYGYNTELWVIPNEHSFNALRRKFNDLLNEFDQEESLLIVYYSGHGFIDKDSRCVWSRGRNDQSVSLPWSALETATEHADCDVLMLLSCCAATVCTNTSGNGITEAVTARSCEGVTSDTGEPSFTQYLIEILKEWKDRDLPLSVTVLNSELISKFGHRNWDPNQDAQHLEINEQETLTNYIRTSSKEKYRTIVLNSMDYMTSPVTPVQVSAQRVPLEPPTDAANQTYPQCLGKEYPREVRGRPQDRCPAVLISVALESDERLLSTGWASWLQSAPAVLQHANVEAIYNSDFILCLLSLPLALWNLLPISPAINFVAFVKSSDLTKVDEISKSYALKDANPRLVDFLNDNDEPGLEVLRQQSIVGTSLMPDKSDWLSQGSLPHLSHDSMSEDPGSINTDMGEKHLKERTRLLDINGNDIPPTQWPHIPQSTLQCPFRLLGCELDFENEEEWISHSLRHFEKEGQGQVVSIEPPRALECVFCNATFECEAGNTCWRSWMEHVATHHHRGERLAHARPNFALIEYLWQQELIQATQYRELKGPFSRVSDNSPGPSDIAIGRPQWSRSRTTS